MNSWAAFRAPLGLVLLYNVDGCLDLGESCAQIIFVLTGWQSYRGYAHCCARRKQLRSLRWRIRGSGPAPERGVFSHRWNRAATFANVSEETLEAMPTMRMAKQLMPLAHKLQQTCYA